MTIAVDNVFWRLQNIRTRDSPSSFLVLVLWHFHSLRNMSVERLRD